jgi:4-carboxymuconolactone decarboxylase
VSDPIEEHDGLFAAERLLGVPLVLPLGHGEPTVGNDFKRLALKHEFGDSWTRTSLDPRSGALIVGDNCSGTWHQRVIAWATEGRSQ